MLEAWPPPYKLRKSKRAKNISLKVTLQEGLEVVVPDNTRHRKYHEKNNYVESFLQQHKTWILKHSKTIIKSNSPALLPAILKLNSIAEFWRVKYLALNKNSLLVLDNINTLIVSYKKNLAETDQEIVIRKLLVNWLKEKAENYLRSRILLLANKCNFVVNKINIKKQKTLWGSCDQDKNINLNFKLIFLPTILSDHVIIHELCHTKYMNHSKKFWQLMEKLDLDCNLNKKHIKSADNYIPIFI